METLLKNGYIYRGYPEDELEKADLVIKNGIISTVIPVDPDNPSGKDPLQPWHDSQSDDTHQNKLTHTLDESDKRKTIDLKGSIIVPGFVDMHVHLREPGFEAKETIATGTKSAARGGFTSIACMPNTSPPIDNSGTIEFIYQTAREKGCVHTHPIAAITKGRAGDEITEMDELAKAGAVGFSDDGEPVKDAGLMRIAMDYGRMLNRPIISHCEDKSLSGEGEMNEGYLASILGLRGIPAASESIMAARDIILARLTGIHVHIAHLSSAETVDIIREAKSRDIPVTAEVTPHHLVLTEEAVKTYDTNTKVNPPLRTEKDRLALVEGIKDGTIDCIASDHAPHTDDEKLVEYTNAPFGISGLETAFALAKSALLDTGTISFATLINKMSYDPARILNIEGGKIEEGSSADLAIIDLQEDWVVDSCEFASMGKNNPFHDWEFTGKVKSTMVEGSFVFCDFDTGDNDHEA